MRKNKFTENFIKKKAIKMYLKMFDEFETGMINRCNIIYTSIYQPASSINLTNYKKYVVLKEVIEQLRKEKKTGIDLISFEDNVEQEFNKIKNEIVDEIMKKINEKLFKTRVRLNPEILFAMQQEIANILEKFYK